MYFFFILLFFFNILVIPNPYPLLVKLLYNFNEIFHHAFETNNYMDITVYFFFKSSAPIELKRSLSGKELSVFKVAVKTRQQK